ncbi:MAG: hypothetical protein ABL886_11410 [Rhodoglobus sp.]
MIRIPAVAIAALLLLSGCTPPGPDPSEPAETTSPTASPTASSTPTPTPEPIAMPDLTGTEVVLVTTRATAPSGASLDLAMTTYYPVSVESPEGQAILGYLAANGDTSDVADAAFLADNAAILQLSTITATEVTPGVWPDGVGAIPALGPGLSDTVIGIPVTHDGPGWPHISGAGSGYGVAALYNRFDGPPIGLDDWAGFWTFYGFRNFSFGFEVSNCEIVTTALAQERIEVAAWTDVPFECSVGQGH